MYTSFSIVFFREVSGAACGLVSASLRPYDTHAFKEVVEEAAEDLASLCIYTHNNVCVCVCVCICIHVYVYST